MLGLKKVTALFSAVTLVFHLLASRSVHHRYLAGIANFVDVSFHAGLKAAFARRDIRAKLFRVSGTGLGIYHLDQLRLAVVGQVLDVRLEAVLDLVSASLHSWALRLGRIGALTLVYISVGSRLVVISRRIGALTLVYISVGSRLVVISHTLAFSKPVHVYSRTPARTSFAPVTARRNRHRKRWRGGLHMQSMLAQRW
jgi:hypothetical protein